MNTCANCKKQTKTTRRGYCTACYQYWQRYGRLPLPNAPRTRRCECGEYAFIALPVRGLGTLYLCEKCYAEELITQEELKAIGWTHGLLEPRTVTGSM
jgi:hypothetical protein